MTPQETFGLCLQVAKIIHSEITDHWAFAGYGGDEEAFASLLAEVKAIAGDSCLIHPDLLDAENLHATWYEVQTAIGNGEMEVDWYLH